MSRILKSLLPVSLVLLMCAIAVGKAAPKYQMRTKGPAVDSREWLNNRQSQGETAGRSFGRAIRVGATASPGSQVGNTYYDFQHNASTGRQVDEANGRLQVSWMKAPGPSISIRTINWNSITISGSASNTTLDNGDTVHVFPMGSPNSPGGTPFAAVRPGYTNIRIKPNGKGIVSYHDAPETGGIQYWEAQLDASSGLGVFGGGVTSPNPAGAQYISDSPIWPKTAISICGATDTIHHVIGTWSGAANEIWYWRGVITGEGIDWTGMTNGLPYMVDSVDADLSAVIEANGEEVTIVMLKSVGNVNVDVVRYVSTDCGVSWPANGSFDNLTNYTDSDPEGGNTDLSAVYDDAGDIHILWHTAPASGLAYPTNLFHWSSATGTRLVTSAGWINSCEGGLSAARSNNGAGGRNRAICDVEISAKPAGLGPGAGIAGELLYATWAQFGPSDIDCATVDDQGTLGGYHNADIYMSVSSNGGVTWDRPGNITGTSTPDCAPGDCLSESWITAAATADSGVYLSYVLDTHAGGVVNSEGVWTDNPYMVLAVEARTPVLEPVIAVTPQYFIELNADPFGGSQTVDLNVVSVGNSDLTYNVTVMPDNDGASHVLVNGGATTNGSIAAGGAPDVVTITYDCIGLGNPEEVAWRLEVTSNDAQNDPGQGGTPIDVNLQVFSASTWYTCDNDTLSTGQYAMQVSSCLEMGNQGLVGVGFYDAATTAEWMYSGSPLITLVTAGGDTVAYHNAFMNLGERTRVLNKSFRAQSEFNVTRDSSVTVGDSTFIADVAQGDWSTTDTTIGGTYEMVFPKGPAHNDGAFWKFTMGTLTGSDINGVSYGVVADLDLDDPAGAGGTVGENGGIASESQSWVGGVSGESDDSANFTPYATYMAVFDLPLGSSCATDEGVAGQVLANPNYVVSDYDTDSLYMLTQLFGSAESWGSNIYIDTGQQYDDISVLLVNGFEEDLVDGSPITWGYGLAVSDVSEADLTDNINAIRALANPQCQIDCLIVNSGDVNVSGAITSADIIYMVGYVFKGQAAPMPCSANGDVNCSGSSTSADIIYLVGHVFKGGAAPCDICNTEGAEVCVP